MNHVRSIVNFSQSEEYSLGISVVLAKDNAEYSYCLLRSSKRMEISVVSAGMGILQLEGIKGDLLKKGILPRIHYNFQGDGIFSRHVTASQMESITTDDKASFFWQIRIEQERNILHIADNTILDKYVIDMPGYLHSISLGQDFPELQMIDERKRGPLTGFSDYESAMTASLFCLIGVASIRTKQTALMQQAKEKYRSAQSIYKVARITLLATLLFLVLNFVFYANLRYQNSKVSMQISHVSKKSDSLKTIHLKGDQLSLLTSRAAWVNGLKPIWYLDRVGVLIPGDITLSKLEIGVHSTLNYNLREEAQKNVMTIEGTCGSPESVLEWISMLGRESWVVSIKSQEFRPGIQQKKAFFKFEIIVNE